MNLESIKDQLAIFKFGITPREAWLRRICIDCKQPALPKCHTKAGRYVYHLHSICEECFDTWGGDMNPYKV